MSYIRPLTEYDYVKEANPGDYIFWCSGGRSFPDYIEDYGSCSNQSLMELLARLIHSQKDYYKEQLYYDYLIDKLSEKLGVRVK